MRAIRRTLSFSKERKASAAPTHAPSAGAGVSADAVNQPAPAPTGSLSRKIKRSLSFQGSAQKAKANAEAAAGSMSGGLDIRDFPTSWDISKRLGNYDLYKDNWEKNTVINMVYLLKEDNLKLIFDCGIDDFFYDVNQRFHEKLIEKNIPHNYSERPGNHNWEYWSNSIKYQLLFFNDFFE